MRTLMAGEIGPWLVTELGMRYRRYRLADEAGERDMVQSLRRHGQLTPLVVCRQEETLDVLDGFKRVAAALSLGLVNLRCQVLAADERQAKVALLTLHGAGKRLVERTSYLKFPWPTFYEHPINIATLNVDRQLADERVILQVHIPEPETRTLHDLDAIIRDYLKDFTLTNVIAEIERWRHAGESCFSKLLRKLKLKVPDESILDKLVPIPDG